MASPFTEEEKRFLLAEMIKVGRIDVQTLVAFVKTYQSEPNWLCIELPRGRNMEQCLKAAGDMFEAYFPPPPLSLKRKSGTDPVEPPSKKSAKRVTTEGQHVDPTTVTATATAPPIAPHPSIAASPTTYQIQPRPLATQANGYVLSPRQPVHVEKPPKRPRGRPRKEHREPLRPNLPPRPHNIAPHLAPGATTRGSETSPRDTGSPGTPTPAYSASPVPAGPTKNGNRESREGALAGVKAEPRVVPEEAMARFKQTSPLTKPVAVEQTDPKWQAGISDVGPTPTSAAPRAPGGLG